MKKNILLVMVMMLMTAVNALAQKEYNMVITLNNGTTVTLGHNDIKEITFNDGEVAISGNMVNTIDSLAGVTTSLGAQVLYVAEATDKQFNDLYATLKTTIDNYNTAFTNIAAFIEAQDKLNEAQLATNEQISNTLDQIVFAMEQLHPEIAGAAEIKKAKSIGANASVADMKAALENLKKALENINKK